MGRSIPSADTHALGQALPFSLALLAAWVAAVVGVVALLCGTRSQKSSSAKAEEPPASSLQGPPGNNKGAVDQATEAGAASPRTEEAASVSQPLPPPPGAAAKQQHEEEAQAAAAGFHGPLQGEAAPRRPGARRGLSMNLSMKLPEGLTRIRTGRKEHKEDSIWMKTIIMGEKCRVPDEEEEGSFAGDEKGNRQKSYRVRTPRSLPVSRTNSFADKDKDKDKDGEAPTGK